METPRTAKHHGPRPPFALALIATALAITVAPAAPAQEDAKMFQAGAATANITPWRGLNMPGGWHNRTVDVISDEMHVRALVLDDGNAALAIALVDACAVARHVIDPGKARAGEATGIPVENMLVAATHTHSAASCGYLKQSPPDPEYTTFVSRRIGDAITLAWQNRVPARIGWGSGSVPDEVFNRRWYMKEGAIGPNPFGETTDKVKMNPPRASEDLIEPAGPTDPEVAFLALETADGEPLALLANYSLHYVGGVRGVSADYFGVFAERIGELLGANDTDAPFVGILSNGTSGDINNINFREPRKQQEPFEQVNIVANKVAAEVLRAYGDAEFQDWVPLDAAWREVTLGVRKPSAEEVAGAKALLAAAGKEGRPLKGIREVMANCTVDLADYPDRVDVPLQALRIGDLGIAAIPCEVFAETGLAIKAKSPFAQSFTIELANGYNGYLPTERQHALGGYETWRSKSTYLEVTAASTIQATVLDLMAELAQ